VPIFLFWALPFLRPKLPACAFSEMDRAIRHSTSFRS